MSAEIKGTNKERFEKTIRRKEKLATFLYDIAKSIFTVMVLTGVAVWFTQGFNYDLIYSVTFGIITTVLLAWNANRILKF